MHVMFDDCHGNVALFIDLFEKIDGVVGVGARHASGGFVQKQKFGFLHQAHRHLQTAFVATGHGRRLHVTFV